MSEGTSLNEDDFWQQGGNPIIYLMTFITARARDRAIDLDRRTVYRTKKQGGLEEVAIFTRQEDARSVVAEHNTSIQEIKYKLLHDHLGTLIDRIDSSTMGDPIV
jgi:hypothetical protein